MLSFLHYRTKLLPRQVAEQFARCLRANSRFAFVAVEESKRSTKAERFLVRWQPSSASRQAALVDAADSQRARRGCEQEFVFLKDTDGTWICFSAASGAVYSVSQHGCTCPDHTHRLAPSGHPLKCKHQYALMNQTPAELGPAPVPTREFDQARFEAIFGA